MQCSTLIAPLPQTIELSSPHPGLFELRHTFNPDYNHGCILSRSFAELLGIQFMGYKKNLYLLQDEIQIAIKSDFGDEFVARVKAIAIEGSSSGYKIWLPYDDHSMLGRSASSIRLNIPLNIIAVGHHSRHIEVAHRKLIRLIVNWTQGFTGCFKAMDMHYFVAPLSKSRRRKLLTTMCEATDKYCRKRVKLMMPVILFMIFQKYLGLNLNITSGSILFAIRETFGNGWYHRAAEMLQSAQLWIKISTSDRELLKAAMEMELFKSNHFTEAYLRRFSIPRSAILGNIIALLGREHFFKDWDGTGILRLLLIAYAESCRNKFMIEDSYQLSQVLSRLRNYNLSCDGYFSGDFHLLMKFILTYWPFLFKHGIASPLDNFYFDRSQLDMEGLVLHFMQLYVDIVDPPSKEEDYYFGKIFKSAILYKDVPFQRFVLALEYILHMSKFTHRHLEKYSSHFRTFFSFFSRFLGDSFRFIVDATHPSTMTDLIYILSQLNAHRIVYIILHTVDIDQITEIFNEDHVIAVYFSDMAIFDINSMMIMFQAWTPPIEVIPIMKVDTKLRGYLAFELITDVYLSIYYWDTDPVTRQSLFVWTIPDSFIRRNNEVHPSVLVPPIQFFLLRFFGLSLDSSHFGHPKDNLDVIELESIFNFFIERHYRLHRITNQPRVVIPKLKELAAIE